CAREDIVGATSTFHFW
nr:immunoglobulin heavy chain junction region [Macaca mulatta]MOV86629.1 immunoglobulin heavy chain junction region [Macaca mulatta]MOV87992.1 immunoglobulin heavy chain junction region [Macaca mulatta]MOV89329.1 immunoglobulin heavy chain junction region [Macaca mulatta]MOV89496.1 immunoglobulin heavy chain junction region [Macaca mulatta]